VVLYILFVAIANLAVGFAVAVHVGRRYREMQALAEENPTEVEQPLLWQEDEENAASGKDEPQTLESPPDEQNDPRTEFLDRTGLEAILAEWRVREPERERQLNAAMIDIDRFAHLNQSYGDKVGDRILHAIAQIVAAESRDHTLDADLSGQRLLLLFPDIDLRSTINVVERIRQTLEKARLHYASEEIKITASCAVTQVTPEDTADVLYGRLEAAVHEAKRYGRNRTFVHEGKYPTPVAPPTFTLEEKSVSIEPCRQDPTNR